MSRKYKIHGEMHRSQLAEKYLLRLPLFYGLGEDEVRKVSTEIFSYFSTPA
jgi:dTDP-4-amino-4,6-dideoxygalactose transaminase